MPNGILKPPISWSHMYRCESLSRSGAEHFALVFNLDLSFGAQYGRNNKGIPQVPEDNSASGIWVALGSHLAFTKPRCAEAENHLSHVATQFWACHPRAGYGCPNVASRAGFADLFGGCQQHSKEQFIAQMF